MIILAYYSYILVCFVGFSFVAKYQSSHILHSSPNGISFNFLSDVFIDVDNVPLVVLGLGIPILICVFLLAVAILVNNIHHIVLGVGMLILSCVFLLGVPIACLLATIYLIISQVILAFFYLLRNFNPLNLIYVFSRLSEIKEDKVISSKYSDSNSLIQLIHNKMDEEGRGLLSEIRVECEKLGLTQSQVDRKLLIFVKDHYYGRFRSWMKLPRLPRFYF
jgi:hypothetical protein